MAVLINHPRLAGKFWNFNWRLLWFSYGWTKWNLVPAEFASEISTLKEKLLVMASYAETAVSRAVKALLRRDDELARRTREEDDLIDRLEVEIDQVALRLLSCRPASSDLRFVAMAMKIANNLERVGDEATTISRRVLELSREAQLPQTAEIPPMAGAVLQMLKDALDAFVGRDPIKARAVIPRDDEVDRSNRRLYDELTALMAERPATITRALNLIVISKSLERIGDHAANVAEQVVYLCEGRDIRHAPAQNAQPSAPTNET
jgi:phosphate transport system protein